MILLKKKTQKVTSVPIGGRHFQDDVIEGCSGCVHSRHCERLFLCHRENSVQLIASLLLQTETDSCSKIKYNSVFGFIIAPLARKEIAPMVMRTPTRRKYRGLWQDLGCVVVW